MGWHFSLFKPNGWTRNLEHISKDRCFPRVPDLWLPNQLPYPQATLTAKLLQVTLGQWFTCHSKVSLARGKNSSVKMIPSSATSLLHSHFHVSSASITVGRKKPSKIFFLWVLQDLIEAQKSKAGDLAASPNIPELSAKISLQDIYGWWRHTRQKKITAWFRDPWWPLLLSTTERTCIRIWEVWTWTSEWQNQTVSAPSPLHLRAIPGKVSYPHESSF